MRFLILFISLALVSCGSETAQVPDTNSTTVQVSFGSNLAMGALLGAGKIPANIEVISLQAFAANGAELTPAVTATKPSFNLAITIPNGKGIIIRALGFNAAKTKVHEGKSAPLTLVGSPKTVPILLSMSIKLSASPATTPRGGTVALTGSIAGIPPTATSPLLWNSAAGTVTVTPATNGETANWVAPATLGTYTIGAKVDPNLNPDQDPNISGTINIDVINQTPVTVADTASTNAFAPVLISVLTNDSDPDGDTLTLQAASKPANGTTTIVGAQVQYTPDNGFTGTDTFTYGISDGFGGKATGAATVTVNPLSVDIGITDSYSNASPVSGSNVTFTVTVTGDASLAIPSVLIASTLPAGLSPVSTTPSQGSFTNGKWNTGPIAAGATATLNLVATVQPNNGGSTITHAATIQALTPGYIDNNANNDSASAAIVPIASADVSVTVVASGPKEPGQNMKYIVTVSNAGPDAATGVIVSDTYASPSMTYLSNTGGGAVTQASNILTWNVGALASGSSQSIDVNMKIAPSVPAVVAFPSDLIGITYSNSATVTATTPDPVTANDSVTGSFITADESAPIITFASNPLIIQQNGSFPYSAIVADEYTPPAPNIVATTPDTVNTAVLGTTNVTYTATDAAGNSSSNTLTVIVNNAPQAGFGTTSFQQGANGYFGTQDTDIWQEAPNLNHGQDPYATIDGETVAPSDKTNSLLQFNSIFGVAPGMISPGSTISNATLTLHVTSGGQSVNMTQLLSPWDENTATWTGQSAAVSGGTLLRTLAGRAVENVADLTLLGPSPTVPVIDVKTELQNWSGGAQNFGWGFKPSNALWTDGVDFETSEASTIASRPLLNVSYYGASQIAVKAIPNTNLPITLGGADIDGDPISIKIATLPLNGDLYATADGINPSTLISTTPALVTNPSGIVIFKPASGFSGQTSFTYVVNDGYQDSASSTMIVHVDNDTPTITLNGGAATVALNTAYTDLGATASDPVDGVITGNIITKNNVDVYTAGTYTVTYNVSDAAGNAAAEVSRTVKVDAPPIAGSVIATFRQGTNGYTGGQDTRLKQDFPDSDLSGDTYISSTGSNNTGADYYGLLQFADIFGPAAGQVPLGSSIIEANLSLHIRSGGNHVDMVRMNSPWLDSTANWNTQNAAVSSGTFLRRLYGRTISGTPLDVTGSMPVFDVYTEIASWSAGTPNYGWGFLPYDAYATDGTDFGSHERVPTTERPELSILYHNNVIAPSILSSTNVTYTLGGFDPNGDPLTATITTLPTQGSLYFTPDGTTLGTLIGGLPVTVADGTQVIYVSATPSTPVADSFQYTVNDGISTSAPVSINITPVNNAPVFTATPAISGSYQVGTTLNIINDTFSDVDGDSVTISYQWQSNGVNIAGATSTAYTAQLSDVANPLTCVLTLNDNTGATNAITTFTTTAVSVLPTHVRVLDFLEAPVTGVDVQIYDLYTDTFQKLGTTDVYGTVNVTDPYALNPVGEYILVVDTGALPYASGYWTNNYNNNGSNLGSTGVVDPYVWVPSQTNPILFVEPGVTLSGAVTDHYGAAVPFAEVSYGSMVTNNSFFTFADPYGNYATGVVPGDYWIGAEGLALDIYGQSVPVPGGEAGGYYDPYSMLLTPLDVYTYAMNINTATTIDMQLILGSYLSGTVIDSNSQPVAKLDIGIDGTYYRATTNASGFYQMNVHPGTGLHIRTDNVVRPIVGAEQPIPNNSLGGYASSISNVVTQNIDAYSAFDFVAGSAVAKDLQLPVGALIQGTVTDAYSALPIANVEVAIHDGYSDIGKATTDAVGTYTVAVPAGTYQVNVRGSFWDQATQSNKPLVGGYVGGFVDGYSNLIDSYSAAWYSAVIGSPVTADAVMVQGGTITGTVLNADGYAANGIDVQLRDPYSTYGTSANIDGTFGINVPVGSYNLWTGNTWWDQFSQSTKTVPADWITGYVDNTGNITTDSYSYAIHTISTPNSTITSGTTNLGRLISIMTASAQPSFGISDGYTGVLVRAHIETNLGAAIVGQQVNFAVTANASVSPYTFTDIYGDAILMVNDSTAESVSLTLNSIDVTDINLNFDFIISGSDADNDGLTALQEYALLTNPNNPDTDGDGFKDGVENAIGTNPLLINDVPILLGASTNTALVGKQPSSVATHDLNSDGLSDVLVGTFSGDLYTYLGDGTGAITASSSYASGASGMNQFTTGLVNTDPYVDVVMPSEYLNLVKVMYNNGAGVFSPYSYAVDLYANPKGASIANLNNDSYADIVTANWGAGSGTTLSVLHGTGSAFTLGAPISTGLSAVFSVASEDFNQDGYSGLAAVGLVSTNIATFANTANALVQTNYTVGSSPAHIATGLINSDSYTDLVVSNFNSASVSILFGNSTGTFSAPVTHNTTPSGQPKWSAIGDMDGDGFADIVIAESFTHTVAILKGDGVGGFYPVLSYAVAGGSNPNRVALADMNGDGKLDVVAANFNSANISVLLNTGP